METNIPATIIFIVIMGLACYLAYRLGKKDEKNNTLLNYKRDVNGYLQKSRKVDKLASKRKSFSRGDILSGKPFKTATTTKAKSKKSRDSKSKLR